MFKLNTYIIISDDNNIHRIARIKNIDNDDNTMTLAWERYSNGKYYNVMGGGFIKQQDPRIRSLKDIHKTPVHDQIILIKYYVSKILINKYNHDSLNIDHKNNIIIKKQVDISEDIVYKDIGQVISEFAQTEYHITGFEGNCLAFGCLHTEYKVSNISINEFICNGSLRPFEKIAKMIHEQCESNNNNRKYIQMF